jgi:hypothetical protein
MPPRIGCCFYRQQDFTGYTKRNNTASYKVIQREIERNRQNRNLVKNKKKVKKFLQMQKKAKKRKKKKKKKS